MSEQCWAGHSLYYIILHGVMGECLSSVGLDMRYASLHYVYCIVTKCCLLAAPKKILCLVAKVEEDRVGRSVQNFFGP